MVSVSNPILSIRLIFDYFRILGKQSIPSLWLSTISIISVIERFLCLTPTYLFDYYSIIFQYSVFDQHPTCNWSTISIISMAIEWFLCLIPPHSIYSIQSLRWIYRYLKARCGRKQQLDGDLCAWLVTQERHFHAWLVRREKQHETWIIMKCDAPRGSNQTDRQLRWVVCILFLWMEISISPWLKTRKNENVAAVVLSVYLATMRLTFINLNYPNK